VDGTDDAREGRTGNSPETKVSSGNYREFGILDERCLRVESIERLSGGRIFLNKARVSSAFSLRLRAELGPFRWSSPLRILLLDAKELSTWSAELIPAAKLAGLVSFSV